MKLYKYRIQIQEEMAKLQKNVNLGSHSGTIPSPNEGSNQCPTSGGSRKKSKKSRS